jgi:hypothetical protein
MTPEQKFEEWLYADNWTDYPVKAPQIMTRDMEVVRRAEQVVGFVVVEKGENGSFIIRKHIQPKRK